MESRINYIANRYILKSNSHIRYINGYNILKGEKIAKPFTAFYPNPEKLHKKTIDQK